MQRRIEARTEITVELLQSILEQVWLDPALDNHVARLAPDYKVYYEAQAEARKAGQAGWDKMPERVGTKHSHDSYTGHVMRLQAQAIYDYLFQFLSVRAGNTIIPAELDAVIDNALMLGEEPQSQTVTRAVMHYLGLLGATDAS